MAGATVSVILKGMEINAKVGVHAWEKYPQRPTRLVIDLTLVFENGAYFAENGGYVDYDPLRAAIANLATQPHVEHLETIAKTILDAAFSLTRAQRAVLRIVKPDIFNDVQEVGLEFDVASGDAYQ